MELQIEYRPGEVRVILQGPRDSQELERILSLLQWGADKLWAADGQGGSAAILPPGYRVGGNPGRQAVRLHGGVHVSGGLQPGVIGAALGAAGAVSLRQVRFDQSARSTKPI